MSIPTSRFFCRYVKSLTASVLALAGGVEAGLAASPGSFRSLPETGKVQPELAEASDVKVSLIDNLARRSAAVSSRAERTRLLANPIDAVLPGANPSEWFSVGEELCNKTNRLLQSEKVRAEVRGNYAVAKALTGVMIRTWGEQIAEDISSPNEVAHEAVSVMMAAACPDIYWEMRDFLLGPWTSAR